MSAPPEANTEYSRGSGAFGRLREHVRERADSDALESHSIATTADRARRASRGALLIVVAQFPRSITSIRRPARRRSRPSAPAANHAWAPIPLALLAAALAYAVYRHGSRTALARPGGAGHRHAADRAARRPARRALERPCRLERRAATSRPPRARAPVCTWRRSAAVVLLARPAASGLLLSAGGRVRTSARGATHLERRTSAQD